MYFHHADGTFELVPQTGGMLVYYLQRGENVKAFPPGFQMLAGDPSLRGFSFREVEKSHWTSEDRTEAALRQRAVGFNCLNYKAPAEAALGLRALPEDLSRCKDGIRAEVFFPSCWDGKRVTAPDHKDHMRYPSLMDDGVCPESHPIRLVSLFFETIWNVDAFTGKPGKYVFSSGDPTGYGYHGDFMNAWDQDVLQRAVDECRSPTGIVEECGVFEHYTRHQQETCEILHLDTEEDVVGPMEKLPGCNGVQTGPHKAMAGMCEDEKPKDKPEPVIELPEDMNETDLYELPTMTKAPVESSSAEATPTPKPEVVGGSPAFLVGDAQIIDDEVKPLVKVVTVTQFTTVDASAPTPVVKRRHGHGHRHGRAF